MTRSTAIAESKPSAPEPDIARLAGRGTAYITVAKLWFMVSGYGIYFTLPRLMTKEQFGLYQVAIGVVSIINAVIITGTYQTVSKYISEDESKADLVKAKSLKLQVLIGGGASLAFFLLAPVTAYFLNDSRVTGYLRIASLITLSYSFYAVFTGYFNGQKRFLTQAALDMTYSTLKLVLIVLMVWLGYGVAGGVMGFALAAAGVLAISAIVGSKSSAGPQPSAGAVRASHLFRFQSYLLLFTLVLNLLQKVDLILIKSLSSNDASITSINVADYGSAINLANITYQIIVSVTFVIFPLVSQSTFADELSKTQSYISNTVRYTLMIMAGVATLLSANSAGILRIVYPAEYQSAGRALSIVAYGLLLFGLIHVLTTIISASGRPLVSLSIGLLTLCASAALNATLVPRYGIVGAAIATTSAMLIGALSCSGYLMSRFKVLVPLKSMARIAFAAGVVYTLSRLLPDGSKLMTLVALVGAGLVYLICLVLTGELGRGDLSLVKRVVKG